MPSIRSAIKLPTSENEGMTGYQKESKDMEKPKYPSQMTG